jgi:NTE family protein
VLTQAVSVAVSVTERENLRNADLVLAPSLVGIGGTDFSHADELIQRGYQAAAQKERFLATLALNDSEWAVYQAERRSRMKQLPPPATRLVARSVDSELERHAKASLDRSGAPLSLPQVEHELSTAVTSAALPGAFYRLSSSQPSTLVADIDPRLGSQTVIRPTLELSVANGEPTRGALRGFATVLPQDAFLARYRVQFSIGYSPMIAAEYERSIDASQWFWSSSLNLERQNSATYNGSQHFSHWQDTYSTGLDLGYGLRQRFRLRAGLAAGYEHLSDSEVFGALPDGNGAYLAPRLQVEWNSLDEANLPTRGVLFSGSIAARYRRWDARTVPLGQASFADNLPVFSGTLTASASAASSFGVALNYFDLFPLGGPADLRAFRYEQFHATSFALGGLAYRRRVGGLKLFGLRPQMGAWYEADATCIRVAERAEWFAGNVVQLPAWGGHICNRTDERPPDSRLDQRWSPLNNVSVGEIRRSYAGLRSTCGG